MRIESDDDFEDGSRTPKKVSVCLLTRIAFYGCLGLALITLGIFIVTNLSGQ